MLSVTYSGFVSRDSKFACVFDVTSQGGEHCVVAQITSNYLFDSMQEVHEAGKRAASVANRTGVFPPMDKKF